MRQPGFPGFFASAGTMWQELGIALSLLLVLEGILPFLWPRGWRESVITLLQLDDRGLRAIGLASMLLGVSLLYWLR